MWHENWVCKQTRTEILKSRLLLLSTVHLGALSVTHFFTISRRVIIPAEEKNANGNNNKDFNRPSNGLPIPPHLLARSLSLRLIRDTEKTEKKVIAVDERLRNPTGWLCSCFFFFSVSESQSHYHPRPSLARLTFERSSRHSKFTLLACHSPRRLISRVQSFKYLWYVFLFSVHKHFVKFPSCFFFFFFAVSIHRQAEAWW